MFTPFLIVSVAEAWQLSINKHLLRNGLKCAGMGEALCGAWQVALDGWLLWDVDYQVVVSIQGIIPAACIAEHLLRDGAQDRVGGHLGRRQGAQGCPNTGPRTPGREGQWPTHRAVRGSYSHLQQGEKHKEGLSDTLSLGITQHPLKGSSKGGGSPSAAPQSQAMKCLG